MSNINDDKNQDQVQREKEKENKVKCGTKFRFYGSLRDQMNIMFVTDYLDTEYADQLFNELKQVDYDTDEESMIKIFGKQYQIPRKQIAFGQPGANYHFSGSNVQPYDWNQTDQSMNSKVGRKLKDLALRVSKLVCTDYNYVLCNNYLDQTKCIGYHQDDEKELGDLFQIQY